MNIKTNLLDEYVNFGDSTLQRYRNDIKMLSPYKIKSNSTIKRTKNGLATSFNNNSHREPDVKRLQTTSNDL